LHEAGAAFASRSDLFGQFDDVDDNVHVLELMDVGRRYRREDLAQFQVQATLEFMEGRDVEVSAIRNESGLPAGSVEIALAAEVSRGAARRTGASTYRCENTTDPGRL